MDCKDHRASLAHQARKVLKVHKDRREMTVWLDPKAPKVQQDRKDPRDYPASA